MKKPNQEEFETQRLAKAKKYIRGWLHDLGAVSGIVALFTQHLSFTIQTIQNLSIMVLVQSISLLEQLLVYLSG